MRKIPRYKRDSFIFVSNLKDVTADPENPETLRREAYLLSERYSSERAIGQALWVRSRRNLLMSDNGNFSRIKKIARRLSPRIEGIADQAETEMADRGAVGGQTLSRRRAALEEIAAACRAELDRADLSAILSTQARIRPHYLIGMEDLTLPVAQACGMLNPEFDPRPDEVKPFQEATGRLLARQAEGEFGRPSALKDARVFGVVHAFDYASAAQGATLMENAPIHGAALSFAGPMLSRRWIHGVRVGADRVAFEEKLPEAYVLATALTLGLANGLTTPTPVHLLGLGSPILFVIMASVLRESPAVSIDSTAPFKDAYAGTIYGTRYAPLKMKAFKVAALALIHNRPYESKTPFFRAFEARFPADWAGLRTHLAVNSSSDPARVADLLGSDNDLVKKRIPFFARLSAEDTELMRRLRLARSGHNYWVLRSLCVGARRRRGRSADLDRWTAYHVKRYRKHGSRKWAAAVLASVSLIQKYGRVSGLRGTAGDRGQSFTSHPMTR